MVISLTKLTNITCSEFYFYEYVYLIYIKTILDINYQKKIILFKYYY